MPIPIFAHFAAASSLLPVITGIYFWKQHTLPIKVFIIFCFFGLATIMSEFVLGKMGISNHSLSNYYLLVEFICVLYVYHRWTLQQWLKDGLQYSGMVYILIWFINKYFYEDPARFSETITTVASGIFIASSIIILHEIVNRTTVKISQQTIFWIASGILLYSSGTIIVMALSNTILEMGIQYFDLLWHINWGFVIIANLMYARSFSCKIF